MPVRVFARLHMWKKLGFHACLLSPSAKNKTKRKFKAIIKDIGSYKQNLI